jgi:tRNA pseudouridine55 synthase
LSLDGILNLNKPKGKTSFDIVALVRRLSGERRVGHAGTLDPEATGVLPICLGLATRLVEFLADSNKIYHAEIEFGLATDTYDATGKATQKGDSSTLSLEEIEDALASFLGTVSQLPPIFSAVKYQGKPLYRWARAGIDPPRKARRVEFFELRPVNWEPPVLSLVVECGKGAYIRSLAHDLGQKLGCGAHLKSLVRARSGPFHIGDAVSVTGIEQAFVEGYWPQLLHPMDVAVHHLPSVTVDGDDERAIANGRPPAVAPEGRLHGQRCRAYSHDKRFLALLRYDEQNDRWQPEKVFVKEH